MIDVKQAVNAAMQAAHEFYGNKELTDLGLEEVELSDDERFWLITLGFYVPSVTVPNTFLPTLQRKYDRKYKLFKVNTETGHVESMKIRQI